jgi:AraC-like DNA-binding protein
MVNERNIAQNIRSAVPEAVGMNINNYLPAASDLGGQVRRLSLRDGFDLSVYDICAGQSQRVDAATDPCVSINVILKGGGSALIHDQDLQSPNIPYLSGTTYVCVMHNRMTNTMRLPAGVSLKGIDIRLGFAFLQRLSGAPMMSELTAVHPWHYSSGSGAWIGLRQATGKTLSHAGYVLQQVLCERPDDLVIESRVLEILSTTFSQLKVSKSDPCSKVNPKHARLIARAYQLLLSDITHPWTIREISSQIGLNEKCLKAGFKQQYGQPIFQFLQNQRLLEAQTLLQQANVRVVDVAMQVGYANPSHFAYLYKRQFGVSPSQVANDSDF